MRNVIHVHFVSLWFHCNLLKWDLLQGTGVGSSFDGNGQRG
jgi:hypothetical protein